MCGIFTLLNNNEQTFSYSYIESQFMKGKNRGPENSQLVNIDIKAIAGFHRLAINGLNDESNQPIVVDNVSLICNGEIYNYKELYKMMNIEPKTQSDCEVVIHLYLKYGIEQTLQMLDGVFSFVLIDYRICTSSAKIYIARDPYGVRPLYMLKNNDDYVSDIIHSNQFTTTKNEKTPKTNLYYESDFIGFASEAKMLCGIKTKMNDYVNTNYRTVDHDIPYKIAQFLPGTYSELELKFTVNSSWKIVKNQIPYHTIGFHTNIIKYNDYSVDYYYNNIRMNLKVYQECKGKL
jgi:hypothetical protein